MSRLAREGSPGCRWSALRVERHRLKARAVAPARPANWIRRYRPWLTVCDGSGWTLLTLQPLVVLDTGIGLGGGGVADVDRDGA
jgi:hypothetical protein